MTALTWTSTDQQFFMVTGGFLLETHGNSSISSVCFNKDGVIFKKKILYEKSTLYKFSNLDQNFSLSFP